MMNKRLLIAGMAAALSLTTAGAPIYAATETTTVVEQDSETGDTTTDTDTTTKPSDDKKNDTDKTDKNNKDDKISCQEIRLQKKHSHR